MSEPTTHSHALNPECIPPIELKSQIKIKAVTSDKASRSILHSSLRFLPLMRTIRRRCSTPYLDRNSCSADNLRETDGAKEFILYEDNEMIIFTKKT